VTAALEIAAFVLILNSSTRAIGLALGALIMVAAIGTLFRAHQFVQAIPAAVVLVISVLLIS
jgi:predicted naringenin-chalcone synthase